MALPGADASNLTALRAAAPVALLGNASEGRAAMSTPAVSPPARVLDMRDRLNLDPTRWGVRALAEIGVAIALAAVLGQVRLFVMPPEVGQCSRSLSLAPQAWQAYNPVSGSTESERRWSPP